MLADLVSQTPVLLSTCSPIPTTNPAPQPTQLTVLLASPAYQPASPVHQPCLRAQHLLTKGEVVLGGSAQKGQAKGTQKGHAKGTRKRAQKSTADS